MNSLEPPLSVGGIRTSVRFNHVEGPISNNDQIDVGIFEHPRINIV